VFRHFRNIIVLALTGALGVILPSVAFADEWVPDDIRVDSFVKARWGQLTHNDTTNGIPVYNKYTPNNTWCGCVATAVGMAMRYLKYPESYDWGNMPLTTLTDVQPIQAEAIGRLMGNLANWSEALYLKDATYIYLSKIADVLRRQATNGFGYAEADYIGFHGKGEFAYDEEKLKRLIVPCCDYGSPVVLTIDPKNVQKQGDRHSVTIDGYGYSNGVFCVHARCGGYGVGDGWFVPPKFAFIDKTFETIEEAIFNILPHESGTIVSGRVIAPNGIPADGADVTLIDAQGVTQTVRTSARGIYAFLVKNMGEGRLSSTWGAGTANRTVLVEPNVGAQTSNDGWQIGNTYGNDLNLVEPDYGDAVPDAPTDPERVVAQPTIAPPAGTVSGEFNVTIVTATAGAVIRYTTDNTEPSESSAVYAVPVRVNLSADSGVKVFRAKAWKNGLEPSNESVAVYVPSIETVSVPVAKVTDATGKVLTSKNGVYTYSDRAYVELACSTPGATIRYTLDGSVPTVLSPVYTKPLRVTEGAVVTANAWRDKWYTSSAMDVSLAYDPKATKLSGDDFASPVVITGREGTKILDSVYHYTLETREEEGNNVPLTDDDYNFIGWYANEEEWLKDEKTATLYTNAVNHGYVNVGDRAKGLFELYNTAWFEWTAPATGKFTFTLACTSTKEVWYWKNVYAVYDGQDAELKLGNRIVYGDNSEGGSAYSIFSVDAVEGHTYKIVTAVLSYDLKGDWVWFEEDYDWKWCTDETAQYELSWSMDGAGEDDPPEEEEKIDLSSAMVLLSDYVNAYSGKPWAPRVDTLVCNGTILEPYVDYVYEYEGEQDVGTGTVILSGCGNYEGRLTEKFSVTKRRIVDGMIEKIPDMQFTGQAIKPEVSVKLESLEFVEGRDFDVTYLNNIEVGLASVVVTGKGGCYGTAVRTFEIVDCPIGEVGEPFGPKSIRLMGVDPDSLSTATKVEAAGLPAGLILRKNGSDYVIEGTPTEILDNDTRRAYLLVTLPTKEQKLLPLKLIVTSDEPIVTTVIDQSGLRYDKSNEQAVVSTGVSVHCPVTVDTDAALKITPSGLPAGLSFVDKNGVRAIQGVATKPGVYLVTLTAASGKTTVSVGTAAFRIEALPEWAQGAFAGSFGAGSLSVTVAAGGKISTKATRGGVSLTASANAYDSETDLPSYALSGTLSGKGATYQFAAVVTNWIGLFEGVVFTNATLVGSDVLAYRNLWKDKRLTAALETVAGTYTHKTAAGEILTLTVDPKGTVKVAGTINSKRKVSASSVVDLTEFGTMETYIYLAADKTNGEYSQRLTLVPYHDAPMDYGNNAYRDGAVSYAIGGVAGCAGSGTVALSPKYGQAAVGKAVTLTAKADKNSTFVKWVQIDGLGMETPVGYTEKLSVLATGSDLLYKAVFRDKTSVAKPRLICDLSAFAALRVGVAFDQEVLVRNPNDDGDDLVRPVKFTAANLPAGLKLDAASGRISGVPTKDVSQKAFTITATSTIDKNVSTTETLANSVAVQPELAQGTFVGSFGTGSISMTAAAGGKLSGKVLSAGTSYAYAATGFAAEKVGPAFILAGELTAGKTASLPFSAAITNWIGTFEGVVFTNATLAGENILAYRNPWKDKRLTTALELNAGTYTHKTAAGEILTLTVDPKGTVKVAGTLNSKRKVSASSAVDLTESGTMETYVYLAADKTNVEYSQRLELVPYHDAPADYGNKAYRDGAVSYEIGGVAGCAGSGTVTLSPKYGQATVGKAVALTAKADKNSTFVKWVQVDGKGQEIPVGYAEKLSVNATGDDLLYKAVFRNKASVASPRLDFDAAAFASMRVGVGIDVTVKVCNPDNDGDDLVRPVKFSAANLPAGLKLDAVSGRVSGVPTKAVKGTTFTITATSTVDKGKFSTETVACSVAELPEWAQGTFVGRWGEKGSLTLTVANTGKVSAKAAEGGTNWTYAAASYAAELEDGSLVLSGMFNAAKEKVNVGFDAVVTNWPSSFGGVAFTNATLVCEGPEMLAYRIPWTNKTLSDALSKSGVVGTYSVSVEKSTALLAVDAKGGVKASGTLADGRKLSMATSLIMDETGWFGVYLYVTPASEKPEIGGFVPISQK